jgi:hypothetical protein
MKKTLYYRRFHQKKNDVTSIFNLLLTAFASLAKRLCDVFVRTNMGERYFSTLMSSILIIILAIAPFIFSRGFNTDILEIILSNPSWYIFVALYIFFCIKRYKELRRDTSLFDFTKFSLSTGDTLPLFEKVNIKGVPANPRQIAVLLEPVFFFIIGVLLILFKQEIGLVITVSSICYWFTNYTSFLEGDNFVLDIIDDKICANYFINDFANGSNSANGFSPTFRWPADPNLRRTIVDGVFETEEFAEAS